jgi:hypothetical protein
MNRLRTRPFHWCRWRSLAVTGVVAVALSAVILTGGGVAQAAGGPQTKTIHLTIMLHHSASRGGMNPAASEVVATYCTVQVNYPHNSTHVPETVNVTGGMTCTPYPVVQSDLSLQLYYNGESYAYDDEYLSNVLANPVQAATPCLNGDYYATIDFWLYMGPDWTPNSSDGQVASPVQSITC